MKKISVLLVVMMLFTSITSFAAVKTFDGEAAVTVNPTTASENFTVETVDGFAGKLSTDKVYKITGKSTNYGANYVEPGLAGFQSSGSVEYSLLFEDEASVHTVAVNYYNESNGNGGGANNIFKFSPSYDYVKANAGNANLGAFNFELNKWYRIAIDYTYTTDSTTTGVFAVYINGEAIGSWRYNYVANGVRRLALGCGAKADGTNSVLYMDNITSYLESDEDFDASKGAPSAISLSAEDVSIPVIDGTCIVPEGYTAGQLKDAVFTTDGETDNVRIYNKALTTELDSSDVITDAIIVAVAKNGRDYETAYSYCNVTNEYVESDDDLLTGATDLSVNGITVDKVPGVYGKDSADSVYSVPMTSGNASSNYIDISAGQYLPRVLEFAFAIPSGSNGFRIESNGYTNTSGSHSSIGAIAVKTGDDGLKYKVFSSSSSTASGVSLKPDTWYNMAIEFPGTTNNAASNVFKIYINGECVVDSTLGSSIYGMRHIRMASSATGDGAAVYLDNIRSTVDLAYNAQKDALPVIEASNSNYELEGEVLKVKSFEAVSALKAAVTKDDLTSLRVYDSEWNLKTDDESAEHGDILVAATTNKRTVERAYAYYQISEYVESDSDLYTGSVALQLNDNASPKSTANAVAGLNGKTVDDLVYEFVKNNSAYIEMKGTSGVVAPTSTEFSFMLPDEDTSAIIRVLYYTKADKSSFGTMVLNFNTKGTSMGSGGSYQINNYPFEIGKWYTVAITLGGATEYDENGLPSNSGSNACIWINGRQESVAVIETVYGLRNARMDTTSGKTLYLDNLKVTTAQYDSAKDANAVINVNNGFANNGKLKMISDSTLNDLSTNSYTDIRIYDSEWSELDELAEGCTLVVATTNKRSVERRLDYYTVSFADIVLGREKSGDTAIAKAWLKNASGETAVLIAAQYDMTTGELSDFEIGEEITIVTNDIKEITVPYTPAENSYVKIMLWDGMDTIVPLTASTAVN